MQGKWLSYSLCHHTSLHHKLWHFPKAKKWMAVFAFELHPVLITLCIPSSDSPLFRGNVLLLVTNAIKPRWWSSNKCRGFGSMERTQRSATVAFCSSPTLMHANKLVHLTTSAAPQGSKAIRFPGWRRQLQHSKAGKKKRAQTYESTAHLCCPLGGCKCEAHSLKSKGKVSFGLWLLSSRFGDRGRDLCWGIHE